MLFQKNMGLCFSDKIRYNTSMTTPIPITRKRQTTQGIKFFLSATSAFSVVNNPPLIHDTERTPVHSLTDLLNAVRERSRKGHCPPASPIQRYKGLGENKMKALHPALRGRNDNNRRWSACATGGRKMLKVVLDSRHRADQIFTILMGDEVEPRRRFIEDNALNVRNLDV